MSVIIPSDQLTLTEKARMRQAVITAGIQRSVNLKIQTDPAQIDFRQAQNIQDFNTVGRERWLTANLALINTPYSVWTTLAAPAVGLQPQLANNKLAAFWGVALITVPNPVSLLSFRLGAQGGTTYAVFNLEDLEAEQNTVGYFDSPVPYDPLSVLNVTVTTKIATGIQAEVVLFCYIFEPKGQTTS